MPDPIRITYVIPTLDQSGAERQLTLLANHLPRSDYDVRVIALNRGGYFADVLRSHDIPVSILQKRFRFDPVTYFKLRRELRQHEPHIVQSFLFSANTYVRLPGICRTATRVIVSERCVDSWKSGWQLQMDRQLRSRMHAMTANSDSVAEFYASTVGVDRSKLTVIPNGVPIPSRDREDVRAAVRQELGRPLDARLVGFVGRLVPQKRLDSLIWSFQLLRQTLDNVYLVIVGEGPERDMLAEVAQGYGCRDRIHFLGHRTDAAEITAALDVFCLPSSFEGMSNSLMDAMAAGVPAVVSDIASNCELIRHEQNGLVYPVGEGTEMTRRCKRILTDSEFARTLAAAARKMIEDNHRVELLVDRHCELYRRLLQQ